MRANRVLHAASVAVSLVALSCTEDVGPCPDDGLQGQDTVLVAKQVQYAGQAIMNRSCAIQCHNHTLTGTARNGAPHGLDFDLTPISEGADGTDPDMPTLNSKNGTVINLTEQAAADLRARQRLVFEKRNDIWQQVKDGLMPPDGKFAPLRVLKDLIADSPEETPCKRATVGFQPITTKPTQDILRDWLACSVPIVEAYGKDVGINGVNGKVGYQYLSCTGTTDKDDGGMPSSDAGTPDAGGNMKVVTLEDLQDDVFDTYACSACHPSQNPKGRTLTFASIDALYASLVTDTAVKCNGKPYITPGDPSMSWLYDVISKDDPGCGTERMPQGQKMTTAQIKEVSDWITQGAKRAADVKSVSRLAGGLDAGI